MRTLRLIAWASLAMLDMIFFQGRPVLAQDSRVLVVHDDAGGSVGDRALEIRRINALRVLVEIRGSVCLSSCTMYLGAEDVCVGSDTVFGFHGPWNGEAALAPAFFEFWSEIMARHYSPALRSWFLEEARFVAPDRVLRVRGRNLAPLGYRICDA